MRKQTQQFQKLALQIIHHNIASPPLLTSYLQHLPSIFSENNFVLRLVHCVLHAPPISIQPSLIAMSALSVRAHRGLPNTEGCWRSNHVLQHGIRCPRLTSLNTLISGHVERHDCSPMRCWRVTHFYVFLHDALHMRLSVGVIHLGRGHTNLTSRLLMWCYECSWGYLTLNSGADSHFCRLCLRHVIWHGALVGSRAYRSRWRKVVTQILWPVPEAAVTVLCTPDDGCDGHPKHVERFCSK
jgi:hypothetical protein